MRAMVEVTIRGAASPAGQSGSLLPMVSSASMSINGLAMPPHQAGVWESAECGLRGGELLP